MCTFCATAKPVDPHPGDYLSVFCNLPDTLGAYGLDDAGRSFLLTRFSYSVLVAADPWGIYLNAYGSGMVSASVDSQDNFRVAWNSDPSGAGGQPDHGYAKGVLCPSAHEAVVRIDAKT